MFCACVDANPQELPFNCCTFVLFFLINKYYSYQQILHYHMEQNEYGHVIDTCKKYG